MTEHGAYRLLMDLYYVREKILPQNVAECCRLVRAKSSVERKAVTAVLSEFFEKTEEGWNHKRCDAEIVRMREKKNKAKGSANARWNPDSKHQNEDANAMRTHTERSANAMRTQCEGNAPSNQTPVTSNQSPEKEKKPSEASPQPETGNGHDPSAELWANAIAILREQGVSQQSARSFIALQLRTWDEDTVAASFSAAVGKANAKAYVLKILEGKPKRSEKTAGVVFKHGQATIGGFVP